MIQRAQLTPSTTKELLRTLARDAAIELATRNTVTEILADVRTHGTSAALSYTAKFDRVALAPEQLAIDPARFADAAAQLRKSDPTLVHALQTMIDHVRRFAQAQRESLNPVSVTLPNGGTVGERWVPLRRVGVYVPGGRAFYPSTLVMTVIPAQIAGVSRIVAITPPQQSGLDVVLLCTAHLLGLQELYTLGGAQGIGWLAFAEPSVDLIAGPGNRFVAEAKRQLVGTCGIDSVAGPTEVLILADDSASPIRIAEDLLAQAEHDPDAAAVCASTSESLLNQVEVMLRLRVSQSPRKEVLELSLQRYGFLLHGTQSALIDFAQEWAPEHLELVVAEPQQWLPSLTTAGAVFVGSATAEAFGDYGAGPNHVLPTARTARYSSPLGVATYMKRQSVLELSAADAKQMSHWVGALADAENLFHHAHSARLRG